MRFLKGILGAVLVTVFCLGLGIFPSALNAGDTGVTRILFIGNSKTTHYGSPAATFEALAKGNNRTIEVDICATAGKTLQYHYTTPENYAIITSKPYDIVVIQPGTEEYLDAYGDGKMRTYHKLICEELINNNPDVQIYTRNIYIGPRSSHDDSIFNNSEVFDYYLYKRSGQNRKIFYDGVTRYFTNSNSAGKYVVTEASRQAAIKRTLSCQNDLPKKNRGGVIDDGAAMYTYADNQGERSIFRPDLYHQSAKGSGLIAAVFYKKVFGEMPQLERDYFYHKAVYSQITGKKFTESANAYFRDMSDREWKEFKIELTKQLELIK